MCRCGLAEVDVGTLIGLIFAAGLLLAATAGHRPVAALSPGSRAARNRWVLAAAFGVSAATVGLLVTGLPVVAGLSFVVGLLIPRLLQGRRDRRRRDERRAAWPDAIDNLCAGVTAGLSLADAVCGIGISGPECLRADFRDFAGDYRLLGNFNKSVVSLRDRLADPVADRVVEALLTARELGGRDLGQILRALGDFVRQELRLRGEAEARRSWTVNGARLAAIAPWAVLALLSSRPGTVEAFRTPPGSIVLGATATVTVIAYWLMIKIGRLPEEPRVLVARAVASR